MSDDREEVSGDVGSEEDEVEWEQLSKGRKQGRNERCECGSGLKYKRCCGR